MNDGSCLVVDDDEEILDALKLLLADSLPDVYVEAHADPVVALERIKARDFDVIAADFRMPRLNGVELLSLARKARPKAYTILFTGNPAAVVREGPPSGDVDLVLMKPVDTIPFVERLRALFRRPRSEGPSRPAKQ